jgi:signal transduction histidine kinase/ActR/RegA family two-component response regulator
MENIDIPSVSKEKGMLGGYYSEEQEDYSHMISKPSHEQLEQASRIREEELIKVKQPEDAMRTSAEILQPLLNAIHESISLISRSGTIIVANETFAARLGKRVVDCIGQSIYDLEPVNAVMGCKQTIDKVLLSAQPTVFEDESHGRCLYHSIMPVLNAAGVVDQLAVYTVDITERKQMEAEIIRAHKLESLGVLASGIAHDFNNLMAIAQGYIDLAIMDLPPDHVSRQRLQTAMKSIEQTQNLTNRLISFSRGGGSHRTICDVSEIIRDAVERIVKGTEVKVNFDFMGHLWPVDIDEHQLTQVFYNLTTNAMETMPEGGNLTIKAVNQLLSVGEIPDLKEGSYLMITFDDDGIGIPAEHLNKVFEPYFTTKKMGAQRGLGLGLAVCYSVLKKHNGHIEAKLHPGQGASLVLYLPARADLIEGKEIKKMMPAGPFRILIMDDEPNIRELERVYLERMGYAVTDVKDGQEAIDNYKKAFDSGNPFNLVMLDLTVSRGLGGHLAMERLLKIDPSIKAIIISGYADDHIIENYSDYGFLGALRKPFKKEEIERLVEMILHG